MKVLVLDRDKLRGLLWKRQTEVAEKMGIHTNTIAKKLKGERPMTIDDVNSIAKAGGFSVDEFVSFSDLEPK